MKKIEVLAVLMFACFFAHTQVGQYDYKRELLGVNAPWHKLILPNELFGKLSPDFSDIRILGENADHEIIEAPYILDKTDDEVSSHVVPFKIINTAYSEGGHYFTLALQSDVAINQIELDFKPTNFDWRLRLEGSHNQQQWLTILEDYRILSIQNKLTRYQFTTLKFPKANYRFFRLFVNSREPAGLLQASMSLNELRKGNYQKQPIKKIKTNKLKSSKQTEIVVDFEMPVPISQLSIDVQDSFDYYRPITIQYAADSFETVKGWHYIYYDLTSATLSSMEENTFTFNSTILQKLKIIIHNYDNQALNIHSIEAIGPVYEMIIRFTEDADFFLTYGSNLLQKPNYDINHFASSIPKELALINLGTEQKREGIAPTAKAPLFKNKAWLWGIMVLIILLLGWFSLKMIKEK